MTTENIFKDLPKGKTTGFCQPVGSSVWKDGGIVVQIFEDCIKCSVGTCMMFETISGVEGKSVKRFTEHMPEWPKNEE